MLLSILNRQSVGKVVFEVIEVDFILDDPESLFSNLRKLAI